MSGDATQVLQNSCKASLTIKMVRSSEVIRGIPPGIYLIRSLRRKDWSFSSYRYAVLLITFIAYTCYHASRKPTSIVKSVLDPEPSESVVSNPWPMGTVFVKEELLRADVSMLKKGWAPFDGKDGTSKLGEIDVAFLACYSMGMYVAGHLGDRVDLRLFLTTGMIGSGIFVALFGMGYFWNIHAFWFFLLMQMIAGLFQATGWPSVVAVIGNWFGKRKRGLIMGIWNAHTSVGNITGSLLAASVLEYGWGWSFIVPGAFIFLGGILVYLFLAAYPEDVGFPSPYSSVDRKEAGPSDPEVQSQSNAVPQSSTTKRSVGLLEACLIPGVIPFSLCLFFSKLVAYTFLYWLPFYLSQTAICGEFVSVKSAGNLSTLFDVGGIIGGIVAGHLSDKLNARATTAATFMYAAIPSMVLYRHFGSVSMTMNIVLMMIVGLFVNGPYALITTAVSADLGTHSSLKGDSRALATVTAIIDGTGSLGAALGPLLTGFLSTKGWDEVFVMLMIGAFIAGLLLSRLVITEITDMLKRKHSANGPHLGGPESQPFLSEQR